MSSEIRANKQTNRAGLGTVTYADTGIIVSGIVTCTELSGLTALNIAGVGTASTLDINGDIDVDGHTNLDNVSIAGVTTMNSTLNIVSAQPLIYLNNTSYENDYQVQNLAGTFTVRDVDRGNNVFQIGKTGLSTFSGQLDVQGNVTLDRDLDVDGHTNLDNVSIAGVTTLTHATTHPLFIHADTDYKGILLNGTNTPSVNFARQTSTTTEWRVGIDPINGNRFCVGTGEGTNNKFIIDSSAGMTIYNGLAVGGNVTLADSIIHDGDADTKIRFPAADQISFETSGTEYLKLHRYSSVNFVEVGASAALSLANNGSGNRYIVIGDGNASSTGALKLQAGGGSTGWGGGITMYSHANTTNAGGVYIGKSLNSSGAIIFGNGGTSPSNEYLRITSTGNVGINTISPQGNLDVWGSIFVTSQGDGSNSGIHWSDPDNKADYFQLYMNTNNDLRLKTAGGAWKDTIHIHNEGRIGIGTDTPGTIDANGSVDIIQNSANSSKHFRVLNKHATLGGGVQFFNNNQRGGLEFLSTTGTTVGAFYHSTGGWTWDKELQLLGTDGKLRIGTTSGNYLLNVDTGDGTDGHIIASFNGEESSNHAGLNIAHYLCGSDDNRTGLQWEHQNVSNERMWMGDDLRLYLKSTNPTSSTQNGRYIMTVAAGYPDFPSGSSADNAAYSALEIKKHYPNSQSGNYWIYDNNNTPRQIYCDMEIDGGGWMLWHDHNYGQTSMNEALGGSASSPSSNLARGNWGNYAYYNVLIRATQIDATGERLHSIVQLDGNGALKRVADYGSDFLYENVGDQYDPTKNYYFESGSTSEYVGNTMMYQPQCGATGWENFSNGGNSAVFIREMDSRLTPGMHRSCHLVERIYNFDSNGIPIWTIAESMHPTPHWSDFSTIQGEAADGTNPNIQTHNVEINSMNGNNGPSIRARSRGVLTGTFEYTFQLGYNWGWSIGALNSTIGIENSLKAESTDPYSAYTNPYYHASLYNNSSNNNWYATGRAPWQSSDVSQTSSPGINYGNHVLWRETDGTIKARDKSGTHSYNFPVKFAGPLIMCSGSQSPHYTKLQSCWNSANSDTLLNGRNRWYK